LQGLLRMTPQLFKSSVKVVRLWVHECERVLRDRLVNETDMGKYDEYVAAALKSWFKEEPAEQINVSPNLFAAFMDGGGDGATVYNQVCWNVLHDSHAGAAGWFNDC
jgi:dynein heavy chain, axonemal